MVVVAWYDADGRMLGSIMAPISGQLQLIEPDFAELPARLSFHCFDSLFRLLTVARDVALPENI